MFNEGHVILSPPRCLISSPCCLFSAVLSPVVLSPCHLFTPPSWLPCCLFSPPSRLHLLPCHLVSPAVLSPPLSLFPTNSSPRRLVSPAVSFPLSHPPLSHLPRCLILPPSHLPRCLIPLPSRLPTISSPRCLVFPAVSYPLLSLLPAVLSPAVSSSLPSCPPAVSSNIIGRVNSHTLEVGDGFLCRGSRSSIISGIDSGRFEVDGDGCSMELGQSRSVPGIGNDSRSRSIGQPGSTARRKLDEKLRVRTTPSDVGVRSPGQGTEHWVYQSCLRHLLW